MWAGAERPSADTGQTSHCGGHTCMWGHSTPPAADLRIVELRSSGGCCRCIWEHMWEGREPLHADMERLSAVNDLVPFLYRSLKKHLDKKAPIEHPACTCTRGHRPQLSLGRSDTRRGIDMASIMSVLIQWASRHAPRVHFQRSKCPLLLLTVHLRDPRSGRLGMSTAGI